MASFTTGQLAARAQVRVDTVRYYERRGLLPRAPRRASGYRVFDDAAVERIGFIKRLQSLGLTLEEVDAMIREARSGATCRDEAHRIQTALDRVEERLAELRSLRSELRQARADCASGSCQLLPLTAPSRTCP